MTGAVAPGKQCVMVLKKRTCLVIESPIIKVDRGKRGRGGALRVNSGLDGEGVAVGGGGFAGGNEVAGEERAEGAERARCGAGVKSGVARKILWRKERSGMTVEYLGGVLTRTTTWWLYASMQHAVGGQSVVWSGRQGSWCWRQMVKWRW